MANTPDLSKIVDLIMQNPKLIEEISALARDSETVSEDVGDTEIEETSKVSATPEEVRGGSMREHRRELLSAMKPYLSEGRRSALDSMSSILDIIDVMVKR